MNDAVTGEVVHGRVAMDVLSAEGEGGVAEEMAVCAG